MRAAFPLSASAALLGLVAALSSHAKAASSTDSAPHSAHSAHSATTENNGSFLLGRVFDERETPIATALVLLVPSASLVPIAAKVTDKRGKFTFSDLPPGRYVLLAIHGHHSPGRSGPVVVGKLGTPFPLKVTLGGTAIEL